MRIVTSTGWPAHGENPVHTTTPTSPMKQRLKAWLPAPETIRNNRWLRWLGPLLHQPRLWHFSRKGIALGLAIGIFFGLLIPVAQIPFAATLAVVLRANLPMAVASTLVTNPVTFGPVYYGAYQLGKVVVGEPSATEAQAAPAWATARATPDASLGLIDRVGVWARQLGSVGKPLFVGLLIVASISGLLTYVVVSSAWALKTRWNRRRRIRQRVLPGCGSDKP